MSLTSELKIPDSVCSTFIDRFTPEIKRISAKMDMELRNSNYLPFGFETKYPYMLIGTALDYRLRFYFNENQLDCLILNRGLSLLNCIKRISEIEGQTNIEWSYPRGTFSGLYDSMNEFIRRAAPARKVLSSIDEEVICRYCLILATIDHIARGGSEKSLKFMWGLRRYGTKRQLASIDDRMVADISRLSGAFAKSNGDMILDFTSASIGGSVKGSRDVGGADFDFIVDDCLFEIKTTKNPLRYTYDSIRQVLGYIFLDYIDEYKIKNIGLIFPRQDRLFRFNIFELVISADGLKALRVEFRGLLKRDRVGNVRA